MTNPDPYSATIDLSGSVAVVLGGSEGIGAAIARGLARAGATVVIGGRSAQRLEGTAALIGGEGGDVHTEVVDAQDPASITAFRDAVLARRGTPTVLVNSMGGTLIKAALDVTVEEWDTIHTTHLRGSFLSCQSFAPAMIDNGYGKMINLSSTWAFTVARGRSVYAAAKAGLSHLTSALSLEWAAQGVRVNALAPTMTTTPRVEEQLAADPERRAYMLERLPLGRLATSEDMVGPALFLAGHMSDFITGHTLLVDGGWVTAK